MEFQLYQFRYFCTKFYKWQNDPQTTDLHNKYKLTKIDL